MILKCVPCYYKCNWVNVNICAYYFSRQKKKKTDTLNEALKSPTSNLAGTPRNVVPEIATSVTPMSSTSVTSSTQTAVVPDSSDTSDTSSEGEVVMIG